MGVPEKGVAGAAQVRLPEPPVALADDWTARLAGAEAGPHTIPPTQLHVNVQW